MPDAYEDNLHRYTCPKIGDTVAVVLRALRPAGAIAPATRIVPLRCTGMARCGLFRDMRFPAALDALPPTGCPYFDARRESSGSQREQV